MLVHAAAYVRLGWPRSASVANGVVVAVTVISLALVNWKNAARRETPCLRLLFAFLATVVTVIVWAAVGFLIVYWFHLHIGGRE
jgi:hypothetical protein